MIRLTRAQVREIDRLAVEKYHMPSIVLMENAARHVADVAMEMLQHINSPAKVGIVCGGGNNGGDGLAAARHLHNRGVDVWIGLFTDAAKYRSDAATQWQIIQAMPIFHCDVRNAEMPSLLQQSTLVIDGLFGTGLQNAPRNPDQIQKINELADSVLSIDLPSGMDCDTGAPLGACIRATKTVTFVAEKIGFSHPAARHYTGEVIVGDIGCPRELIEEVTRNAP